MAPRSKLCKQGRHDFDPDGTCRRKGCEATTTLTMFPMTVAEEEQAYGFSVDRAAQGFRPGDPQQGLFGNPGLSNDEVQAFAQGVKDRHGLRALWLFPVANGLRLDMIAVHRHEQGQGKGTAAMREVIAFADAHGARVYLTTGSADPAFGTTSRARLRRWYKSLGFVMNTGRRKDYTVMADMYRDPQRTNPDDRLRDLERRARQDDPDARRELLRAQERLGHSDESVERLNQTVSALLIAAGVIDVDESLDRIALRARHSADRAQHSSTGVDLDYFVTDPWGHRRRSTDTTAVYVAIVTWEHSVVIGVKRAPIAGNSSITNAWPALDPLERPGAFAWPHETSPNDRWLAPGVDSMPDHRVRAYASIVRAWSDMRGQRTNPRSDTYQEPRVPYGTPPELRLASDLTVSDMGTWPVPFAARAQLPPGVTFYQVVDSHMGYQAAEAELVRAGFGEARSWHYAALGQPQYFLDGEGRTVQRWIRLLGRKRRPDRSIEWIVWRGQDIPPETLRRPERTASPAPVATRTKHKMRCKTCGARRKSPQCSNCGNFVCRTCSTPACAFCLAHGRSNPDNERRRLERLAAQGDAAAQAKLKAIDTRTAPHPWEAQSELARAAVMRVAEDMSGMAWAATYDSNGAIDVQPLVQPNLLRLVDGQDVVFLRRGTPAVGGWVVMFNPEAPVVAAQFSQFQHYEDAFDAWARDPEQRNRARSVTKVEGPWFVPHQWRELATNPGRRRRNPTGRHRGRRTDEERIGLEEVEELFSAREVGNASSRYERFHGVDPTGARVVQVDDGKPGVERKLVVALGEVPETHYRVPWESQKFTGDDWKAWKKRWKRGKPKGPPVHWVHHHMDEAMPLEVLDPETGLTLKLFTTPHTQVTDYWRDGECERCGKLPGKCKCQPM